MKKILALSLACVMAVGLLAGCGGNGGNDSTNESAGGESGTLTVSLASSPSKLDPIHYSGSYEGQIINQVCDRLVAYNDTLTEYAPVLATNWTVSDDGVTYVFQIRQGVHFQNTQYAKGREMTAEDVAYSLNRSAQHSDNNRLAMLDKAEVTGDWEVTCTLKNPDASFLTALTDAGNSIVAKEEVEGWGEDFGYHLSGTGAFCMDKFELDEQAVLSANPDYWLGAPALQKLVFKFISDPNQAANALQTGAVDLATQLSGEAINTVQNAGNGIELLKTEALKINYVRFNAQKGPTAYKAHKAICDREKEMLTPLRNAEKTLKKTMGDYAMEQERKRREAEDAARRAAEEESRRKLEEAALLERAGDKAGAEAAFQDAEINEDVSRMVCVAGGAPKAKGISTSKDWEIVSIDDKAVPLSINGAELRPVDKAAVMRLIRASKGAIRIPGIVYREVAKMSFSRR